MSNTDLVLLKCGVTERKALSKLILGIIEVKGVWQLKLHGQDDLVAAFHNPATSEMVVEIVQQVSMHFFCVPVSYSVNKR